MKRFFFLFLFLLIPQFSYGKIASERTSRGVSVSAKSPETVLLCYERSGSHWLTYCLYRLALGHIIDYNKICDDLNKFIPRLPPNPTATRIFARAHTVKEFELRKEKWRQASPFYGKALDKEKDTLLLLLRDYKECFPRHDRNDPLLLLTPQKLHYFENLEVYHNWPPERRYLVYYEDLVANLEETLRGVLTFLREPTDGIPQFLANLEEHKKFVINAYDKVWGSKSKGEDVHYHANKIDPDLLYQLDELVVARYPHLAPYLERYFSR